LLQAWFQQACCKLMTSTSLLQLVDNLQQVGKIRNLQQVCGVSGCVSGGHIWLKKRYAVYLKVAFQLYSFQWSELPEDLKRGVQSR
jgi:hypothetical protein